MSGKNEIALPFKILSTPAIWPGGIGQSWAFGLISGQETASGEKSTALEAYSADGRIVPGFPRLRTSPYSVAPASQVGVADVDGDGVPELVAVDMEGRLQAFRPGGASVSIGSVSDPVRALLSWPPVNMTLNNARLGFLLIIRNFSPLVPSRNALDVLDASGRSVPGFPLDLSSSPDTHRPLFRPDWRSVFVLLETGAVDAFDLAPARRSPGFPSAPETSDSTEPGHRMALYSPWNAIVVTSGTATLRRIDMGGGGSSAFVVPSATRITGIDAVGERLYIADDASGRLLRVDPAVHVSAELSLSMLPESRTWHLQAIPIANSRKCYIVTVSSTEPDPDARVGPVFEQHATPEIRRKISQLADAEATRLFHSRALTAEQQKEIDHSVTMMKLSYLQNTLGTEKTSQLMGGDTQTRVQVALDGESGMRLVLNDLILGYVPKTGFSLSRTIYPAAHYASDALYLVVPLNAERTGDDPRSEYRSLIRIYQLPY